MKIEFYSFCCTFYNSPLFNQIKLYFENLTINLNYDTIQVWSVFGSEPYSVNTDPKILTIQWSGEACFKNPDKYNINLISKIGSYNIVPNLFAASESHIHNNLVKLTSPRKLTLKTKFCNFIVSNTHPIERKQFFLELSKHKFIDSCGAVLKNWTGEPAPPFSSDEYHTFLNDWRFVICFENLKVDYYLTEKLINAYLGGCIPIYWGCPQIKEFINEKAILLLEDFTPESIDKLIERVMELENNSELYAKMHSEPLFVNNEVPREFTIEYIRNEIEMKLKIN